MINETSKIKRATLSPGRSTTHDQSRGLGHHQTLPLLITSSQREWRFVVLLGITQPSCASCSARGFVSRAAPPLSLPSKMLQFHAKSHAVSSPIINLVTSSAWRQTRLSSPVLCPTQCAVGICTYLGGRLSRKKFCLTGVFRLVSAVASTLISWGGTFLSPMPALFWRQPLCLGGPSAYFFCRSLACLFAAPIRRFPWEAQTVVGDRGSGPGRRPCLRAPARVVGAAPLVPRRRSLVDGPGGGGRPK